MDPSWKYCPVCIAPLCGWLVELVEDRAGAVYAIHEGKSFVGSGADCELRILGKEMCRQHVYLTAERESCTVVDMGNGGAIKVNKAVISKAALIDGDMLEVGGYTFEIKLL
jgi:hypothetical protein